MTWTLLSYYFNKKGELSKLNRQKQLIKCQTPHHFQIFQTQIIWFLGERNALNSRFAWTFGPKNEGTAQGINKIDDTGVFAHFEIL